jgi:hypothetical protein
VGAARPSVAREPRSTRDVFMMTARGAEKPNHLRNDKRNADVKLLLQHQVEIKGNADENLSSRETTIRAKGKKSSRGDRYHG